MGKIISTWQQFSRGLYRQLRKKKKKVETKINLKKRKASFRRSWKKHVGMGSDGKVMLNERNMCGMWQQKGYTGKGKNILNYGIYFKSNRESLTDFYRRMTC